MRQLLSKKPFLIATLLGIVFFFGCMMTVSAATPPVDPTDKVFTAVSEACKWFLPFSGPCLAEGVYGLIYKPTSFVLLGSGYILDKMLMLSIDNSQNMVVPAFIGSSWTVVRDFSNMLFIFILLYTGIQTMLGLGKDWRGVVLKVIVVALLINFSLFFTKVVIDAGNILAVGVKDALTIPGESISESLANSFKPQVFLSTAGKIEDADALIVFVVATIVSGFAAYIFFKVAILFSRRIIVFWALMILSPFAFVSMTLPGKGNRFNEWLHELTHQAFVAPIFLFFIYLILKVINNPTKLLDLVKVSDSSSWFTRILGSVIVAALLVKALQEALKYTESFAGATGEGFSKLVGGAMGIAGGGVAGVALGAAGLAGRTVVGKFGGAAMEKLGAAGAGSNSAIGRFAGRQALALSGTMKTGSYDVRNIGGPAGKYISKGFGAFGVDLKKGAGSWGAKSGKGGYGAAEERNRKAQENAEHARAEKTEVTNKERAKMTEPEQEAFDEAAGNENKNKEAADIAAEQYRAAQRNVENTDEGRAVGKAQKDVKEKTEAVGDAAKNTKSAQADLDAAKSSGRPSLEKTAQKALNDAKNAERAAITELDGAKADLVKASEDLAKTESGAILKEAEKMIKVTEELRRQSTEAKGKAKSILDDANARADREVKVENERRREQYAKDTGGMFSSKAAKQARVDKIRKGRTPEQKEAAKERAEKEGKESLEKTAQDKLLKDLAKKIKEMEEGDH